MICFISVDYDIIQIDDHKNIQLLYQNRVDISLEASWCVEQAKRHHLILKMSISGTKNCLPLVYFMYSYPVVGIGKIELVKSLSSAQSIQRFADQRQRVPILDSQIIEILVINKQAKAPIRLLNKENRCICRRLRKLYETIREIGFNISLQSLQFHLLQAVDWSIEWLLTVNQLIGIIIYSCVL